MKKLCILLLLLGVSVSTTSCNKNQETTTLDVTEYASVQEIAGENVTDYYIGNMFYTDYEKMLSKQLKNLYMPKNEEEYTKTQKNIEKLMTAACYKGFSESLTPYNATNDWDSFISEIQYGKSEWQSTQSKKMCFEIKMQKGSEKLYYYLEFTINEDGVIYQFDIW